MTSGDTIPEEYVEIYESTQPIFLGLIKEVRELSKKKPDATFNKNKIMTINRVLNDLKKILATEPQGKFLDILSDEDLPQASDVVLVMVQYEAALDSFYQKYYNKKIGIGK